MTYVLLDSNLLVLLVVGSTSRDLIEKHKRLKEYDEKDFDLLAGIVSNASGLVSTPNVLTETSNLVRQIGEPARTAVSLKLEAFVHTLEEHYIQSVAAVRRSEHQRLGLTDSVLLMLADSGPTLVTVDLGLYLAAATAGYQAINFNHLRDRS